MDRRKHASSKEDFDSPSNGCINGLLILALIYGIIFISLLYWIGRGLNPFD